MPEEGADKEWPPTLEEVMPDALKRSMVEELPPFDGRTTVGILETVEGNRVVLTSGDANPALSNYAAAGHVEGKAAIYIRDTGSAGGTLRHNNTNGTCGYCDSQLPSLLPEGVPLDVIPPPTAEANNSRAVDKPKRYVGNSRTPKDNRPRQEPR